MIFLTAFFRLVTLASAIKNPTAASYALAAATPHVSAEILVAVAWLESRYSDAALSRMENNRRVTTAPTATTLANSHGPFFCGPLQTAAGYSRKKCAAMRGLAGWQLGAAEIETWLTFCRGDFRCALSGYGCGVKAARAKRCGRADYAARALILAVAVRKKVSGYGRIPNRKRGTTAILRTHSYMTTMSLAAWIAQPMAFDTTKRGIL